jgi:hypothetical protein
VPSAEDQFVLRVGIEVGMSNVGDFVKFVLAFCVD